MSNTSESPVRVSGSPRRRSPSQRARSTARHRSSGAAGSPTREKASVCARSPKRAKSRSPKSLKLRSSVSHSPVREIPYSHTRCPKCLKSRSPVSRSPSPRTKRLRRVQAEREAEKVSERKHDKSHGRGSDRAAHRERHIEKDVPSERRERRSGRDAVDNGSSRSRHERSKSSSDRQHKSRHRSHSPRSAADGSTRDKVTQSRGDDRRNGEDDSVAKMKAAEDALEAKEKQKPSFELSGKLATETNRFRGVTLLFAEPPDAQKPDTRWIMYVMKSDKWLNEPLDVHSQSCYLFGRERRVADIPTDHPSCSKQHAVLQYRQVEKEQPDGTLIKQVRPYIMDLGSTNGTFINDTRIESQRYYELFGLETFKFGNSSREYGLLQEDSA